jgi:hypothetical protein
VTDVITLRLKLSLSKTELSPDTEKADDSTGELGLSELISRHS